MPRILAFVSAIAMMAFVSTTATAQQAKQTHDAQQTRYSFELDTKASLEGVMLPPGRYTIERIDSDDVWRLRAEQAGADPIALIDAWRTPVEVHTEGTKAVVTTVDPRAGETARGLVGFSVDGEFYKIRDVLTVDDEFLHSN